MFPLLHQKGVRTVGKLILPVIYCAYFFWSLLEQLWNSSSCYFISVFLLVVLFTHRADALNLKTLEILSENKVKQETMNTYITCLGLSNQREVVWYCGSLLPWRFVHRGARRTPQKRFSYRPEEGWPLDKGTRSGENWPQVGGFVERWAVVFFLPFGVISFFWPFWPSLSVFFKPIYRQLFVVLVCQNLAQCQGSFRNLQF